MSKKQTGRAKQVNDGFWKEAKKRGGFSRIFIQKILWMSTEVAMCVVNGRNLVIPYSQAPGLKEVERTRKNFSIKVSNTFRITNGESLYGKRPGY